MMIPPTGEKRCRNHGGRSPTQEWRRAAGQATGRALTEGPLVLPERAVVVRDAESRALRALGDISPSDAGILDPRITIASMLGIVHAAAPLVLGDQDADALIAGLVEAGLRVPDDLGKELRSALRDVKFDLALKLLDRLGKIARAQTDALRVQFLGRAVIEQLLPLVADFAQRVSDAAEARIPPDQREAFRTEIRKLLLETRERAFRAASEAQGAVG